MKRLLEDWKEEVGKEMSLLEMDNKFSQGDSIFNYDNEWWEDWKDFLIFNTDKNMSSFTYNGDKQEDEEGINVEFKILVDKGINENTIIKITDMYYL